MWNSRRVNPTEVIKTVCTDFSYALEFPSAVLYEMHQVPKEVGPQDLKGREDLRALSFVTIDGEDAKDFDDAVYCTPESSGWRLYVAIADVSYYVSPGTATDMEAQKRGNSVYFPRQVIPMLPEGLSNELCSLKPSVDHLVMVCELEIDAVGVVQHFSFYPGVIHSKARLTYTEVAHFLAGSAETHIDPKLHDNLLNLQRLFYLLKAKRIARGALDFDSQETLIQFDIKGQVSGVLPYMRNEAHQIIEECMLAANVAAAEFLHQVEEAGIYRIHESPDPLKLEQLKQFLALHHVPWPVQALQKLTSHQLAQIVESARDKIPDHLLQSVVLRSLQQARYSAENLGHFGLAYDLYTHFTSPIRRYSDLIVHRMIRARLQKKEYHSVPKLQEICDHLCVTERQADEASRRVISTLKCDYAVKFLGQIFDGTVTGVTRFGFFVQLAELYIDGLVHVSNLHDDYYHFDEVRQVLYGELTHRAFMLGQNVRVMVIRVDALACKIDLDIVESASVQFQPEQEGKEKYLQQREEQKVLPKAPQKKKKRLTEKKNKVSARRGKGWMDHEEIQV